MTKKTILFANGISEELTFEEIYERFFKMIQDESWKMLRSYGKSLNRDEVVQQFTIELWNAFEKYDGDLGFCFSTYLFNRFRKARRDILQNNFLSEKSKFEKKSIDSLDNQVNDDENSTNFFNRSFEEDPSYIQYLQYQPDIFIEENDLFYRIGEVLQTEEKKDLVVVLLDKKSFSVADYAEKWNISRNGANKRLLAIKELLKTFLEEDIEGDVY